MFDKEITIYTCKRTNQKKYKKSPLKWQDFVRELATVKRTNENLEDFFKLDSDSQMAIKESNGGFFLGRLKDGRRLKGNVIDRCALALDLDNLTAEDHALDKLIANYPGEIVIYTTHKHTEDKPRYRIIIAFTDPIVDGVIYEAVSRKFLEIYGEMDWGDDSTHQPNRMMYYPTASKDGIFDYKHVIGNGKPLDWRSLMDLYSDPWNEEEWPLSSREIARKAMNSSPHPKNGTNAVEDPRSKHGIIGTVCRAYGIRETLNTFLADLYEPGSASDRYQLIGANSSNGLWISDYYGGDALVYSFHTNKDRLADGHFYNSFDLIRVLKFGHLDKGKEDLKGRNRPSYNEAEKWFLNDPKVQKQLKADQFQPDFSGITKEEYLNQDWKWLEKLPKKNKSGGLAETVDNIKAVLENDIRLRGLGGIDRLKGAHVKTGNLPWEKYQKISSIWKESDFAGLYSFLESNYGFVNARKMQMALDIFTEQHSFDSAAQFFEKFRGKWDGIERFERLPYMVGGVEDTWFSRKFIRKWALQIVYRAFNPGCKADYVLALTGPQGSGKTTFFETLIGDDSLMGDLDTIEGMQALDQIQGKLIVTMDELKPTRTADVNRTKNFLSKRIDHYRKAYRRNAEDWPRHCVFCATTNDDQFLRDVTGNRRWLPLYWPGIHQISLARLAELREQLWAEVVFWYDQGESWEFSKEEAEKIRPLQESVREISSDEAIIEEYLNQPKVPGWLDLQPYEQQYFMKYAKDTWPEELLVPQKITSCLEIYCVVFNGSKSDKDKSKTIQMISRCLKALGWSSSGRRFYSDSYGKPVAYIPIEFKGRQLLNNNDVTDGLVYDLSIDKVINELTMDCQEVEYLIENLKRDALKNLLGKNNGSSFVNKN